LSAGSKVHKLACQLVLSHPSTEQLFSTEQQTSAAVAGMQSPLAAVTGTTSMGM